MTGTTKLQYLITLLAYYADGILTRDELVAKLAEEDCSTIELLPLPGTGSRETLRAEALNLHFRRARGGDTGL